MMSTSTPASSSWVLRLPLRRGRPSGHFTKTCIGQSSVAPREGHRFPLSSPRCTPPLCLSLSNDGPRSPSTQTASDPRLETARTAHESHENSDLAAALSQPDTPYPMSFSTTILPPAPAPLCSENMSIPHYSASSPPNVAVPTSTASSESQAILRPLLPCPGPPLLILG